MKNVNFLQLLFTKISRIVVSPAKKSVPKRHAKQKNYHAFQNTPYSAATAAVGITRHAENLNSGIFPYGSTTGFVKILAAAST